VYHRDKSCESSEHYLFWCADGNKKKADGKTKAKKKAPVTKVTRPKSPGKSEKQDNQKKAARKAQPRRASLRSQSDGEDRGQSELRYHRDVGHDDPFAPQSDPIAAVLGVPIHVLHAR
jgi:hypothetical protein